MTESEMLSILKTQQKAIGNLFEIVEEHNKLLRKIIEGSP